MSSTSSSNALSNYVTIQTFTGQSTYSADFQQIINKAVQVQEIPLSGYLDQQTTDQNRLSTLQSLDQIFSNLQSAVTALQNSVGQQAISGTSSNSSVASVSVSSGATAGTYQIEVDSLGSATQTVSANGLQSVSDPSAQNISSASSFTLTVNGTNTTITPSAHTLNALVQAINGNSALCVTASIVNVGSSGSPDYRLAIQSSKLGNYSIQLNDGTQNLLNTVSTGSSATYKVDGLSNTISSNSDTISLAPGITVNLLQASPGNPVTITVANSTNAAQTALQQFATAYNAAVNGLKTQHGQNAGALSGDSVLMQAQQALSQIANFNTSSGSITNLAEVGLDLNTSGNLTFNATEFANYAGSNFAGLQQFLGDSTTGLIGAATNALNSLEDPIIGTIKTEESSVQSDLTSLTAKINDQVNQINLFQQNLVIQLSQSDAAIYTLQSQSTFFTGLFQSQNAAAFLGA